jgi:hypothetical protein
MPDQAKGSIDGLSSQLRCRSIASIWPALRDCGQNRPLRLIIACQKCEVYFAMAPDFAICATIGFPKLAVFEARCTVCSRLTASLIPAVQSGAALASP